ncbi:GAF domain-containing protein [Sediminitomix flava]|uniref:GAF domain-containing protein n=1 Tax=Sediminitomix flava TaxID=379075 RepID=A0A315ZVM5_SEDFL|nr:GAF domain-containing protein [Sediminitomix flava]PWJ40773.1 hypothetical protein BC781_10431 [Sediminitomix flava]
MSQEKQPSDQSPKKSLFSLRTQLVWSIIISGLFAAVVIGWIGYSHAKQSVLEASKVKLGAIRDCKKDALESYLNDTQESLQTIAQSSFTLAAFLGFQTAFHDSIFQNDNFDFSNGLEEMYMDDKLSYSDSFSLAQKQKEIAALLESPSNTQYLHYHYLLQNPNPKSDRFQFVGDEPSEYGKKHRRFHSSFAKKVIGLKWKDLALIDAKNGDILYTVKKATDLGTNLLHGPYQDSGMAEIFQKVRFSESKTLVVHSEVKEFILSPEENVIFWATPIVQEQEIVAVLMCQTGIEQIDQIIDAPVEGQNQASASQSTYLVGHDFKIQTNLQRFKSKPKEFIQQLTKSGTDISQIHLLENHHSTSLILEANTEAAVLAFNEKQGASVHKNALGEEVLIAYSSLQFNNENSWSIFTEQTTEEIYIPISTLKNNLLIAIAVVLFLLIVVGDLYARQQAVPLNLLLDNLEAVSEGQLKTKMAQGQHKINHTITALNHLIEHLNQATEFVHQIGKGNYEMAFSPLGKSDMLGHALLDMRDRVKHFTEEEEIRNWSIEGKNQFIEVCRQNDHDLYDFAEQNLQQFMLYLEAYASAFYVIREEEETGGKREYLQSVGCFSLDRKKYMNKKIYKGEGLVGVTWTEGKYHYIEDIPEGFKMINLGLGQAPPVSLLLIPIRFSEQVLGVVELLFLRKLKKHEIKFCCEVTDSFASYGQLLGVDVSHGNYTHFKQKAEELEGQNNQLKKELEHQQSTLLLQLKQKKDEALFYKEQLHQLTSSKGDNLNPPPQESTE